MSRINEIMVLEYQDIVNQTIISQFKNSIRSYNKNVSFTAVFAFSIFKWSGSSRKINFQLSINSLQNCLLKGNTLPQSVFDKLQQLPIKELYSFYQNASLPPGLGTDVVNTEISALQDMDDTFVIQSSQLVSNAKTSLNSAKIEASTLFSKSFSVKNSLISLLKSNMKNAFTDIIYVSSDVDSIEIIMDVPAVVTIGNLFTVSVKAKKSSGLGVSRVSITASITTATDITSSVKQNSIENLISTIGDGRLIFL